MKLNPEVEQYRFNNGKGGWSTTEGQTHGLFFIDFRSTKLKVIACDGKDSGWDHVSVSLPNRCPNWIEMSKVKDLFFGEDETVIQFHPKKSEYVNNHPNCLHLWRKYNEEHELPPSILTGVKELGEEDVKKIVGVE